MVSLLLATHCPNKIKEISTLLAYLPLSVCSGIEMNLPEVEENGATFEENACLKAFSGARYTGLLSLADDSGFCIPALNNFPGIQSKRWAKGDYPQAFQALQDLLMKKNLTPPVPAFFQTVLALAWPNGQHRSYFGKTEGHFVMPPRPLLDQGRAYDPVFLPKSKKNTLLKTFGEMTIAEKNQFSHRSQAIQALKKDFPWIL